MIKTLALLSGKGGSGKTTMALSMATMLSKCGIKVLLVDCDLSTNGATYFYESKLINDSKTHIISFYDILYNNYNYDLICNSGIKINSYFDFIPSVSQITEENTITFSCQFEKETGWKQFYKKIYSKYDIVLFDCQAGYTDMLKLILPEIDSCLFVMEADAISSSAIRSLYLKIGSVISSKKVYQVFNKATPEEYEIYSKLSGGTVFTNIETVTFDWKIRKAFSIVQVPDLDNTSAQYWEQIYNICKTLFLDETVQKHIQKFNIQLKMLKSLEEEEKIQREMLALKNEKRMNKKTDFIIYIITIAVTMSMIFTFYLAIKNQILNFSIFSNDLAVFCLVMTVLGITLSAIGLFFNFREKKTYYNAMAEYQKKFDSIRYENAELKSKFGLLKKEYDGKKEKKKNTNY